jgi:DNA end-binding protein Ku
VIEITEFVPFGDIDPVYFESSYYLVPERGGEKAYAVLYQALRETNLAAVGQMAMHNRQHIVILRPGRQGLIAHTMFFENEVRKDEEYRTDVSLAAQREVDVAKLLVQSLADTFQAGKYRDTYREKLEELIAAKIQGREIAEGQAPPPHKAPVIDLFDALQKSLEAARKPPARAAGPETEPRKRTAKRSGRAS